MISNSALLLFSGGQDSTTCLAWALNRFDHVETIGFTYGQRHDVEMNARQTILHQTRRYFPQWQNRLQDDHILDLPALAAISDTALTSDREIEIGEAGLPNTFVPGRNLLFFTYAGALAWRHGLKTLIGGMCETDFSGYPDCRNETLQNLAQSLALGMDRLMPIKTPLMYLTKAQSWALADKLGGEKLTELIRTQTHTCYLGDQSMNEWGMGCGTCPACKLRATGYLAWQESLLTQTNLLEGLS